MNPRFYFATCQIGAEKAVKAEVAAEHPQLRFSFSRPGFITFKEESDEGLALQLNKNIFTRLWGEVVGQTKERAKLGELLKLIPPQVSVQLFERDQYIPGEEPDSYARNAIVQALVNGIPGYQWNGIPKVGSEVYSVIWVDDFHVFLGRHRHSARLSSAPGNIPIIPLIAESPSRAYLKIEEAIHRFHPTTEAGTQVLEVGCSPGGATMAMLNRGFKVMGVDPKYMDQKMYKMPGFNFIQKCARDVNGPDLKDTNPDWIVMDMNIAPLEAIDELLHVVNLLRKNFSKELKLREGFLTIKLNDWKFASSIPLYLKRLGEVGFQDLHATQLCSNRQEFFVYAGKFKN